MIITKRTKKCFRSQHGRHKLKLIMEYKMKPEHGMENIFLSWMINLGYWKMKTMMFNCLKEQKPFGGQYQSFDLRLSKNMCWKLHYPWLWKSAIEIKEWI